jgi:ribosomal protein S18 acetylase RimI-like enzyme
MALTFRPCGPEDLETVRRLADRIWQACYPGIIPPEQIRYMLEWMYAPHKLAAELARGVTYELALLAGEPVGYLAHELQAGGAILHLNKLYLVPELHGRGHGQAMLCRVLAAARTGAAREIELRVNRGNSRAVRAYERAGFRVAESVCQDIGAGFVMDDFVMRRPVTADD